MMKRIFDLSLVLVGLLVMAIPLFILTVMVRIKLGSPIFFRQIRPGLDGIPFEMIKFRSMTNHCDLDGNLLPDVDRFTRFGCLLRSTSLDELPELWNVLKGDMSLVGPRPLLMEYLLLYSQDQMRRHRVRPGITGWAQVNGRNAIGWDEKFRLDLWYVDNHNILLDIKILLLTVRKVLAHDGINADGDATMPRFAGSVHEEGDKP